MRAIVWALCLVAEIVLTPFNYCPPDGQFSVGVIGENIKSERDNVNFWFPDHSKEYQVQQEH